MLSMMTGDFSKMVRSCLQFMMLTEELFPKSSPFAHVFSALQVAMPGSKRPVEVDEVEDLSQLE